MNVSHTTAVTLRTRLTILLILGACSRGATPDIAPVALTPTEYNNSVRDLLQLSDDPTQWPDAPPVSDRLSPSSGALISAFGGDIEVSPWPWPLPEDIGVDDFEGLAEGQSASAYQLEELQKAAVHFGAYTLVSPDFFQCRDFDALAEPQQRACAWDSLERFAQRAWRRPLIGAERTRLEGFWKANLASGSLDEAVALTAAGILQAPQFVFRMQLGEETDREKGRVKLTQWEVASRLSYFLWDSIPDEELFRAASEGELSSKKGIRTQVERMLADPKARDAVVRFHHQWLGTDRIGTISPAQQAYGPLFGLPANPGLDTGDDGAWPAVLGPLRTSLEAEVHLFVEKTVFEGGGTLEALMTDHHGYVSDISAPVYGEVELLSAPTEAWTGAYVAASLAGQASLTLRPARFPRDQRAGVLTLPGVLALGAHPVHPSPILRGKRVLERITCEEIGAPPPTAEAARPPDIVEAESTNRQRVATATSPEPCAMCHEQMNPPGFAFESYDSLGRHRTEDNGQPVDTRGSFKVGGETVRFDDGVELARILSTHEVVQDCYAKRWTDYALGYTTDPTDPDVERLLEQFRKDDDVLGLLESIATSEMFRFRGLGGGR